MPTRTIPAIDGDPVVITHRHPRQSEILALQARCVGAKPQAQYEAYLDWLAGLASTIDGETVNAAAAAEAIDLRVKWTDTVNAAHDIVASRLPAPEVLGNSEGGGDS